MKRRKRGIRENEGNKRNVDKKWEIDERVVGSRRKKERKKK